MSARPGAGPRGACPGPGFRLGTPQPGHHPPQPGQRLPAGGLDGGQGVACLVGTGVEDPAARACLDRDDADAVRHHVVQFAGDPQPLLHRGLGGRLDPHQLGPGLRLPDRMSDEPGNDRENGYGDRDSGGSRRPHGAIPEPSQRGHCQDRNQQARAGHRRTSHRHFAAACRRYVADLKARCDGDHDQRDDRPRLQHHARHRSAKQHGQRRQRPAAQQESGSQQGAAKDRESPHDHGRLQPAGSSLPRS